MNVQEITLPVDETMTTTKPPFTEREDDILPKIGIAPIAHPTHNSTSDLSESNHPDFIEFLDMVPPKAAEPDIAAPEQPVAASSASQPRFSQHDFVGLDYLADISGTVSTPWWKHMPIMKLDRSYGRFVAIAILVVCANVIFMSLLYPPGNPARSDAGTPSVAFDPSAMDSAPSFSYYSSDPMNAPELTDHTAEAAPRSPTEQQGRDAMNDMLLDASPSERVLVITEDDRLNLLDQLNPQLRHNSDTEKYDTYVNSHE